MLIGHDYPGPAWVDQLPLRWRVIRDVHEWRAHAVFNADVIRNCAGFDDARTEARDDAAPAPSPELARMELKLNALFDMVGLLLAQSVELPDAVDCVIQRDGLQWRCAHDIPRIGDLVHLSLYLNRRYLRPLEIGARVERVSDEQPARVSARFFDLDDSVGDGLVKIIFREHRRGVAQSRRQGGKS